MANLITNSEFTTNTTGWTASRATLSRVNLVDEGVGSAGGTDNFGLKVVNTEADGQAYANFATTIGARYVATIRAFSPSANAGVRAARLQVLNSSWSILRNVQIDYEDMWVTVSAVFVATTVSTIIALRCSGAVSEISYFDCVTLNAMDNSSTKYIDNSAQYNGDGSSAIHATSNGSAGAYNNTSVLSAIKGDMGGVSFLIKMGSVFLAPITIDGATNFSIDAYGSGNKPAFDRARTFAATWTEEGSYWYAPVESGANYSRRFVVDGVPLVLCNNKADLATFNKVSWYDSANQRHYIRVDGVNPNSATISANFQEAGKNNAIRVTNSGGFSIKNIEGRYSYDSNFYIQECLDNIEISDNAAMYAGGALTAPAYGVDGIVVYAKGYGGTLDASTGVKINRNLCIGNINNGIECWGLSAPECVDNTLLRNGGGIELWGFVVNGVFDRNIILDALQRYGTMTQNAGRGIWLTKRSVSVPVTGYNTGNKFRNNALDELYSRNIEVGDGNLDVHGNYLGAVLYDGGTTVSAGVDVFGPTASCELINNIFVSAGEDFVCTTAENITGSNNMFFNKSGSFESRYNNVAITSFAALMSAAGLTDCLNANPVVSTDYHLLPTSPCIGAGVDVGLTTDADGAAVPGAVGFDIGPYSYMPGWTLFDGSMPPLSLFATCPGNLLEVQEWHEPNITKKQIDKVSP